MARSRRLLAAVVLLLSASACVPERDNIFDPKNRPVARLLIVENVANDGSCTDDFAETVSYASIASGGRGGCIALDARLTTDPQGDAMSFEFGFLDTAGTFTAITEGADYVAAPEEPSAAILEKGFVKELPLLETLRFAVRATDVDGASGVASATLVLTNTRPVALSGAPRSLIAGGHTGAPGQPVRVFFDGSASFDPDGDDLEYCWSFPDETEPICREEWDDPAFTRSVSVDDPGRYVATLRVSDGDVVDSHPAAQVVNRGAAPLFFASSSVFPGTVGLIQRLDADVVESLLQETAEFVLPVGAARDRALFHEEGIGLKIAPLPSLVTTAAPLVIGDERLEPVFGTDRDGSYIYVGSFYDANDSDKNPPIERIERISVNGDQLAFDPGFLAPIEGIPYDDDATLLLRVDDADNVFLARRNVLTTGGIAVLVGGSTTESYLPMEPGRTLTALAARPRQDVETPEMWALFAPLQGSDLAARIVRYAGAERLGETDLEIPFPTGIAWCTPELFWLASEGSGLRLVDAGVLDIVGLEGSTLKHFPQIDGLGSLVVDPATGAAFGRGADPTTASFVLWEAHADGWSSAHPGLEGNSISRIGFVDADGGLVQAGNLPNGTRLLRRARTLASSTFGPFDAPFTGDSRWPALPDPFTGGLWMVGTVLERTVLLHLYEDGSIAEVIDSFVDESGTELPIVPLTRAVLAPDGTTVWGFDPYNFNPQYLFRLDLTQRPPVFRTLNGVMSPLPYNFYVQFRDHGFFEPSSPATAETPFVWAISANNLYTVTEDGDAQIRHVLDPFQSDELASALIPADNSVCLLTVNRGELGSEPLPYHVLRVDPQGTTTLLGDLPSIFPTFSGPRTLFVQGVGDECWTFIAEDDGLGNNNVAVQMKVWTAPGSVRWSYVGGVSGLVTSMAVTSPERVWLSVDGFNGVEKVRIDFDPLVGTTGGQVTNIQQTFPGAFISTTTRRRGAD